MRNAFVLLLLPCIPVDSLCTVNLKPKRNQYNSTTVTLASVSALIVYQIHEPETTPAAKHVSLEGPFITPQGKGSKAPSFGHEFLSSSSVIYFHRHTSGLAAATPSATTHSFNCAAGTVEYNIS